MNHNRNHNGGNHHRRSPPAPPGLPPHLQHHLQQQQQQQDHSGLAALLLANAAAARGRQPGGAGVLPGLPGHLGAGNSHNGGGFGPPGPYGNGSERHGSASGMSQSAAAQLFEEQILQRASALRAGALMQQQQAQQHSQSQKQQLQIQAALQALSQQQQLSSLNGPAAPPSEEAALLARAAALRDLGIGGGTPVPPPVSALDRIREQIVQSELLRARQQQQQQQQQQRTPYGLEQEIERVRRAQLSTTLGAPKASAPTATHDGASALLSNSVGAAAQVKTQASGSSETKKIILSPSDGSKPMVPSVVTSSKPKAKVAEAATAATTTTPSTTSPSVESNAASSKQRLAPTNAGRTTPPLKPNPKNNTPVPEKSKPSKKTAGAGAAAAAAAAVRCKTKEELRKNPGTVIVPCRARGMPMDHNFISAYFVISEDAKHGENLVCSYYACRNGGIKFRYCAYCMAPVAKRNFSRRHDHGMSKKKGGNNIRDVEEEDGDDDTVDESENTASDKGSLSGLSNPSQSPTKRTRASPTGETESKRPRLEADTIKIQERGKEEVGGEDLSIKRKSMWNDLLNKRPRSKDPKALSSWLNEVLAVSDLEFPLEQVGDDMDEPFGKVLLNELPKLKKPAARPSEDETMETHSTSSSPDTTVDSLSKDTTSQNSVDAIADKDGDSSNDLKETDFVEQTDKDKTPESDKESKADPETPVRTNKATNISSCDGETSDKSRALKTEDSKETNKKKQKDDDEEGFAGSFADWRDRKKGKSLKKGPSSLKK